MAKVTLYPSKISQPNADDKIDIKKWCFKEVRRGGGVYNYGCSSPYDPRYYHAWSNVDELTEGKAAQCGRPSTRFCSHAVSHGIAGYRNTCPIAGCNGTYNTPATLRLYLSKKALADKGIKTGAKVKKVTISFEHRCTGVDVANGKESTNWGPNFYGYSQYPEQKVLKLFFTDKNNNRISKIISTDSHGKDFENPPLSSKYGTVTATFEDITFEEISDGALNIVYGRNLSTNPGNIYIKAAKIEIEYTDATPSIEGKASSNSIITSNENVCRTEITHTITAGYKHNGKWMGNDAPKIFSKNDIKISAPKNVSVTYDSQNGRKIVYKIVDKTNNNQSKKITYNLKGTSESVTLSFSAKVRPKPSVSISSSFKQYLKLEDISSSSLIFKNGCTNDIKIYADKISNSSLIKHISGNQQICYDCSNNIVKDSVIKDTIKKISELPCGKHNIYFVRGGESTKTMITKTITVVPRKYEFKMYVDTENEQEFSFIQDKDNSEVTIHIKRVDDEDPSITPQFMVSESTLLRHRVPHSSTTAAFGLTKDEVKDIPISIYLPGVFTISIQEVDNQNKNKCTLAKDTRTINVSPSHKQYHDILYVRGEDSTSFDYDYLVAWEGDDIKQPIGVEDIELICSYDDLKLCVDEFSTIGLSQTGLARIRIHNNSQQELNFKNIKLELNVLKEDSDGDLVVTTDEFFDRDGMLLNLENNFKMYNKEILDNVSLENLSNDDDMEEEENVYIHIKELEYGDSLVVNIPFECRTAKNIFCQLLIFGEPMQLHSFLNCESDPFDYMQINTYDSIQTNMEIIGETDLLQPNIEYDLLTGESDNQCPNECYNTKTNQEQPWKIDDQTFNGGITYRIKNIDSSGCDAARTIIKNDMNLIPFAIVYYEKDENDVKQPVSLMIDNEYEPDVLSDKVYWETSEITETLNVVNALVRMYVKFPETEEEVYIQRTNKNGDITFSITIPEHINTKYTIEDLLTNVICFEYEGNSENKRATLGTINETITQKQIQEEQNKLNRIAKLTELKELLPPNSSQALIIDNTINILSNDNRNFTVLTYRDTYRRYKPGQTVNLNIHLKTNIIHIDNHIVFNPDILHSGEEDEIIVFYKICNLDGNQGIINTLFKTDTYMLISNQVSKDIYCGIETVLYAKTRIEKRIVEQNTLNIIHINLYNEIRDNHDVVCKIDLGPYPNLDLEGIYDFININMDDGDYNINIENENIIIEWNVGEMKADTQTKALIVLKGKEIGLSEILVDTFDYLHNENQNNEYHFGEDLCDCRKE